VDAFGKTIAIFGLSLVGKIIVLFARVDPGFQLGGTSKERALTRNKRAKEDRGLVTALHQKIFGF